MSPRRVIGGTWVTDMRHYLDDAGRVAEMPGPALNLALFLGAIVAWVTSGRAAGDTRTNVPCRRSPDRRRCDGEIVASFDADGNAIIWHCPICRANGVTHGWQGTRWGRTSRPGP